MAVIPCKLLIQAEHAEFSVFSHEIRVGLLGGKNKIKQNKTPFHFFPLSEINLQHIDSSVNQPMDSNLGFSFIKTRECDQGSLDYDFKRKFMKRRNSMNETPKNFMPVVLHPGAIRNIWGAF